MLPSLKARENRLIIRIEVIPVIPDSRADKRRQQGDDNGFLGKITSLTISDIYTIDKSLQENQIEKIVHFLINPLICEAHISSDKTSIDTVKNKKEYDWVIEIGFLPGVTDNVANTLKETISDELKILFQEGEGVYSSQRTYIQGKLLRVECEKFAYSLANPLIQRITVSSYLEFQKNTNIVYVPKVQLHEPLPASIVSLSISDENLILIGKRGIKNKDGERRGPLALDLSSMKAIQKYFQKLRRNPTDIELESLAQTWSEHCKHTIFSSPIDEIKEGLYKTYIKKATEIIREKKGKKDFCVSVFSDNSGAIRFDENYLITHKVETHNSPSALDPYGGAITGIIGVNRDAIGFGLGAKPVANTYGFCFAPPDILTKLYRDRKRKKQMLPPKRILEGVVAGVNGGGNTSGIPTPQGFLYFDKKYQGKPLVFVGTVGYMPEKFGKKKLYEKKAQPGDYIVMIGGRVGIDGIHGATFSSAMLDSNSPVSAVQIGDPITQKKFSDAIVNEARDLGLYNSITDNGAGGLSCSIAEMAKECNGCCVYLEKVPLKYANLSPWQIWISESQERMTLSVSQSKWKQFSQLLKKRGVEATVIGEFTKSGKCQVEYNGKTIMDIRLDFLHNGRPKKHLQTQQVEEDFSRKVPPDFLNYSLPLTEMVGRYNLCGYEFISMQFDHEVQGTSVVKPLQGVGRVNADATVFRPSLYSNKAVVLSQGLFPSYSELDSYKMAASSIDTAIRNAVTVGADPDTLAILDNFCWCSSDDPKRLYQLKQASKACFETAIGFGTPFISGKDSMFNDFEGYDEREENVKISIPPTLLISSIGVIPDYNKTVTLDGKISGDLIYILGETFDEMEGSEYFSFLSDKYKKSFHDTGIATVEVEQNKVLYKTFFSTVKDDLIATSVSIHHGGLAYAIAKMTMAGGLGANISLKSMPGTNTRDDYALFSESAGRILVAIDPKKKKQFEKKFSGIPFGPLGRLTREKKIQIKNRHGKKCVDVSVDTLLASYRKPFMSF